MDHWDPSKMKKSEYIVLDAPSVSVHFRLGKNTASFYSDMEYPGKSYVLSDVYTEFRNYIIKE